MSASEEEILRDARGLAQACASARIRDNQLGQVLAHLKRRKSCQGTLKLVERLVDSPFAKRTGSTKRQLRALRDHVKPVLSQAHNWEDAARVIGWAKRLCRWAGRGN